MGKKLSPGFRFHPTDVELVKYYLKRKVLGKRFHMEAIAEVDIYKYAPWDLPNKSLLRSGDLKWYFFCSREKKYASGFRMKRATEFGYWKTTGKDRPVRYDDQVVGSIKTLVFHQGKAPKGNRTDWVMYEYKLEEQGLADRGVVQDSYVLCSIFKKDGPGPKNGAQYGAPFREEDWDDDELEEDEVVNGVGADVDMVVPVNQNDCAATTSSYLPETERESTLLCPSETLLSDVNTGAVVAADYYVACSDAPPTQDVVNEDDIIELLGHFREDNAEMNDLDGQGHQVAEVNPISDGLGIYDDLGDLGSLVGFSGNAAASFTMDKGQYLELTDLEVPLNFSTEAAGGQVQTSGNPQPFFGWGEGVRARVRGQSGGNPDQPFLGWGEGFSDDEGAFGYHHPL
ncbi:NAC domain-containing protein 82 [Ricinus communis]|uniref:NAC domain-containing protein 82 n=1 Tax=Ricinus communis TaxID=3988 RepID=UPI00201A73B2|nr:NAC domain-containing protein 82 [Ricinus communis]